MVGAFLLLKWLHVMLACTAFGLDAAYGVLLWRAAREPQHYAHVLRSVSVLDARFAGPAFWGLLATGAALLWATRIPLGTPWLAASLVLYALAALGGWWGISPAMQRQWKAFEAGRHDEFARQARVVGAWSLALVVSLAAIAFLMVAKPG